ncbi:Ras GTPase activating protein ira2, partial [Coemansia sp. RSA 2611]
MFERVITVELERTDSAAELFRRNCLATRLLSNYAKLHGDGYLKATLVPAIRKLLAQPPGTLTFELNPNKMPESADRDRNLANVERLCSLVIDAIVGSVHNLPPTLRWICNLIYRIVIKRFPDAGYTAVGGFIFLRFLCPAIVAPDAHGICSQITNPEVRRGLLLCTKITHNLANDILFGNKETYMVPLNKFISENRTRTTDFLSEIAELTDDSESLFEGAKSVASSSAAAAAARPSTDYVGSEADTDAGQTDSTGVSTKDFVAVQRFIFDHLDRLEPYLGRESMVRIQAPSKPSDKRRSAHARAIGAAAGEKAAGNGGEANGSSEVTATENLFTQVSYLMRQLGPPPAPAEQAQPKIAVVETTAAAGSED